MNSAIKGLTTKKIQLEDLDTFIPKDTEILIDVGNKVAYWQTLHFDIFTDEYILLT